MINQHEKNLNKYGADEDGNFPNTYIKNNNCKADDIQVFFRDIKDNLINLIETSECVFGAVAWLTDFNIMDSLSLKNVSMVVQKEDFLRPDIGVSSMYLWKKKIRYAYSKLTNDFSRYSFHNNMISSLSIASDPTIEPVRCMGNHNKDKKPAFPRMHNKFLIFADYNYDETEDDVEPWDYDYFKLKGVWTGSFNLTYNATMSLENAVYITNQEIINAYYKEFGQIMALSEPLDWESVWSTPEWRIGT